MVILLISLIKTFVQVLVFFLICLFCVWFLFGVEGEGIMRFEPYSLGSDKDQIKDDDVLSSVEGPRS